MNIAPRLATSPSSYTRETSLLQQRAGLDDLADEEQQQRTRRHHGHHGYRGKRSRASNSSEESVSGKGGAWGRPRDEDSIAEMDEEALAALSNDEQALDVGDEDDDDEPRSGLISASASGFSSSVAADESADSDAPHRRRRHSRGRRASHGAVQEQQAHLTGPASLSSTPATALLPPPSQYGATGQHHHRPHHRDRSASASKRDRRSSGASFDRSAQPVLQLLDERAPLLRPTSRGSRDSSPASSSRASSTGPLASSTWSLLTEPPTQAIDRERMRNEKDKETDALGAESRNVYIQELATLIRYMIPINGTHFLEFSLNVVTVLSLGHLGTTSLAAASLASMTVNCVGLAVIQGFCTALDTLCPQAFTSRPKDTSLYAGRNMTILMLVFVPQAIFLWNSEAVFHLLRQDPEVAQKAALYLKIFSLGLPGYGGFETMRRWFQAQGVMSASTYVLCISAPLNGFLNWLLVWGPEPVRLGFVGAPIATAICCNLMCVLSFAYAYWFVGREAWGGWTWGMTRDLGLNWRFGVAGCAMVGAEWWAWEIVSLASSFLGPTALAAQSVLVTSASALYQTPFACGVATAVRIGNLVGLGNAYRATLSARIAILLAFAISILNSVVLLAARKDWGRLFSSEPEIIEIVADILPLVTIFQIADGVNACMGGLLRGAGRAVLGALINLMSYYAVGIPIGLMLTFAGPTLGLWGLWLGLTISLLLCMFLSFIIIWRLDWSQEAERARQRMNISSDESSSGESSDEEDESPDTTNSTPRASAVGSANASGVAAPSTK